MPTAVQVPGGTLVDLAAAAAAAFPDRDAYVELDRRITFAGCERAADGVATLLADVGVGKGDVVCLLLPTSIEYAVCYLAALRLGAVTSGINPRLGPAEQASILARLAPRVTVVPDGGSVPVPAGRVLQRAEIESAFVLPAAYRRPPLALEDPVAVVWTSGTTDHPKGAVYDHARLAAMSRASWPMSEPGDRRLYPLPFAHSGYMTRLWDEVAHGITSVITPADWNARDALHLIGRERVTVGQGVPAQWTLMLRHPDFATTDFSAMRIAGMGAATIPAALVREIQARIGCPVVVRYTSTEACVTTTTSPEDPPEVVAETVGKPVHGVELALLDDAGRPVAPGEIGRIRCRSAAVFAGYWGDPERTAAVLDPEGWLTTGDLGHLDADGNLRITGRTQDMYIRGGYNVYPVQVEQVLTRHERITDAAVVGIPDPVLGEIGAAFVVTPGAGDIPLDEVRRWCREFLADYKAPDRLALVSELPRNPMGKIDRRQLRATAAREFTVNR
jgi:acyl-CoA synthetase (AMP-forming)/AMP-acid ligase II